jgi:hypothetical protein
LKNKKLLNDDIFEFSYNNELFTNEISNIITTFKDNYIQKNLTPDDKVIIYNFYDENKDNKDLHKKIIGNFMALIRYLSINNEKNDDPISEINSKIENALSEEFLGIFRDDDDNEENKKYKKKDLTVNKTMAIFEYFLIFIFDEIKEDLEEYSLKFDDKKLEKKTKDELEKYFKEEKNDEEKEDSKNKRIININNLASALKWFMTLVLFDEKDKENKIKENKKNIINYLNAADLWDKDTFKDNKFNAELGELKKCNIQINKIIWLYDFLVEDQEEEAENAKKEIKDYIEKNTEKQPVEPPEPDDKSDSETSEPESNEDDNGNDDEGD